MSQDPAPQPSDGGDPLQWLADHGDALFGFALRRVQRHDVAEDLVQETLLAGFKAFDAFDHRATVRTWLTSILKNKIIDHFRSEAARETKQRREQATQQASTPESMFQKNGQWMQRLSQWSNNPSDNLERLEFWQVFEACLGKLPASLKAVFVLREMDGDTTDDVCEQVGISKSNASVRLFRARMSLRTCLERNWFDTQR